MAHPEFSDASKIETVKKIYAALNRNDLAACLDFFDADIERFETFGSRHQGLDGLAANFSQGRDTWEEGGCNPDKLTVTGNKVVVFVHVRVKQKGQTQWIDGQVTDVFSFKGSKIIQFYSFADRTEALAWAGASAQRTPSK